MNTPKKRGGGGVSGAALASGYRLSLGALVPASVRAFLSRSLGQFATLLGGRLGSGANPLLLATFHESKPAALRAYRVFNANYPESEQEFDEDMIVRALEFGYLQWPRRIQSYVRDKDVLDIGCGTGIHSIGYVVAGARSYTGVDPRIDLDRDWAKNVRTRAWGPFGWTPRQIMTQFSRVKLVPGTSENFEGGETFDVAILHNVTEHLFHLEDVLRSTAKRLRPGGSVIFNHHNFYCWNGHHMAPKTVSAIDPSDAEQKLYMDWAHIRFDPPEDHYFHRGLNKIRLDELRGMVDRHFDVETWHEIPSDAKNGGGRLTDEIAARFPEITRRDLFVHNVFCVAKSRAGPPPPL